MSMSDENPLLCHRKRGHVRVCMLMVTHACNLSCTYCYEKYKDTGFMSLDMAKSIILDEVEIVKKSREYDRLEVDFMGGEPFMNFSLIKSIVEWIETLDVGCSISAFCSTNGTLVTSEKYTWLREHRKTFAAGLSYDGTPAMQWKNRTSKKVDVPFFIQTWPQQYIRITLSSETLPFLFDGVSSLHSMGAPIQVAMAQGVPWKDEDAKVLEGELERLSAYYLQHENIKPIEFFTRPMFCIGKRNSIPRCFCGAGRSLVTYDIDGRRYPCHMFTPVVLANKAIPLQNASFCREYNTVDSFCKGCLYLNFCNSCYGFNWKDRGNAFSRDHSSCKMVNVWVRACCSFQLNYYYQHRKELNKSDGEHIRAALDAYAKMSVHVDDWQTMYNNEARKEVKK